MITVKRIVYFLVCLLLAGCNATAATAPTAVPGPRPGMPNEVESETPAPKPTPANPSTLAESIPAAEWNEDLKSHQLVPIDPTSGQALSGYEPILLGQAIYHAFSPDGKTLAVLGFESSENPRGGTLHLVDLSAWEDHVQELQFDGYATTMVFSPDGKQLAISNGDGESRILIVDLTSPSVKSNSATRHSILDYMVYKMQFSADGSGLMVYGSKIENRLTADEMSPNPPIVTLLDSGDLRLVWEASLEGIRHGIVPKDGNETTSDLHQPGLAIYLYPGFVFAPGQDILYVVHPDEDKLTTVDFRAQNVSTVEIKPQLSWIDRLLSLTAGVAHAKIAEGTSKQAAVSPDGRFLYIVGQRIDLIEDESGNWQMIENPLGLQIVRTGDGSRLEKIDTGASELSISSKGQYLYLRGWDESLNGAWTQIFDTSTNKVITQMEGTFLVPTRRINGAQILASSVWINDKGEHRNIVFDSQTVLSEWISPQYLAWLTFP